MPIRLRYFVERPQLWLEEFQLVHVLSVSPWTRFELPLSWTVHVGWERLYDPGCGGCLATAGGAGGGFALAAFDEGLLWYLLGSAEVSALAPIRGGVGDLPLRGAIGPESGLRLRLWNDLVILAQGRAQWLPTQAPRWLHRLQGTLRYQYLDGFALDLQGSLEPGERRVGASSFLYF
jgi:hypothetical protein